MFQQIALRKLGQMQFISPQMGPSMSPAFAFATAGDQPVMPVAPIQPPVQVLQPSTRIVPPAPAPAVVAPAASPYADVAGPALVLVAVAVLIGLTV